MCIFSTKRSSSVLNPPRTASESSDSATACASGPPSGPPHRGDPPSAAGQEIPGPRTFPSAAFAGRSEKRTETRSAESGRPKKHGGRKRTRRRPGNDRTVWERQNTAKERRNGQRTADKGLAFRLPRRPPLLPPRSLREVLRRFRQEGGKPSAPLFPASRKAVPDRLRAFRTRTGSGAPLRRNEGRGRILSKKIAQCENFRTFARYV